MKNINKLLACLGVTVACLAGISQSAYAAVAGHVQFVSGDVQISNAAGRTRPAQKGDAINEGDTLASAQKSSAQIKMQDGGLVAVRPDTRLKFDQFVFAGKQDGSEKSFFSLFKGGFRAVTGLIGQANKQNYKITTPAATIGIRGTDHESFVVAPGSPLAQVAPTGAYSKVNVGETYMATEKGVIFVQPNQMGFAGGMNQMPQLQPLNTNIFTVAAAPTVGAKVEKKEEKKESGESKQDQQAANGEKGEKSEKSDDTAAAPVRESAVVDATPPAAGTIPVSTAPVVSAAATDVTIFVPFVEPVPIVLMAGGQTINVTNQTVVSTTGGTTTAIPTVAPAGTVAAYTQTDLAIAISQLAADPNSYRYGFYDQSTHIFLAAPADVVHLVGAGPGTVTFVDRYSGKGLGSGTRTYTLNSTTVGQAEVIMANGIKYGRYTSTSANQAVVGTVNNGANTSTTYTPVQTHWITGPAIDPVYLPEVLLTTNAYTFSGGTTTTASSGSNASLNSATLSVNFTQQLVSFTLNLMVNTIPWVASSTNAPLEFHYWNNAKSGFRADNTPPSVSKEGGELTLTVNGGAALASNGSIVKGQLTGSGLDGALLSYFLNSGTDQVTGVAAFTGTPVTAPSYRLAGISAADHTPSARDFPGGVYPAGGMVPIPVIIGSYNNAASVLTDGAGNVTQLKADGFSGNSSFTVTKGAAVATGLGTDPVSGISWGRWDNASFTTTDIATGAVVTANNTGSAHWIASPTLTGPVTLPVTGTFNYVMAGGTAPTDSLGGAGTLNSASLSANFSAQTVTVGLNVTTPLAGNLIASAPNLPIEQKVIFNATTVGGVGGGIPGSMTVTCGTGCAGTPQGQLVGVFAGSGGIGAAVLYGFSSSANANVVNGVVAFHR